MGLRIGHGYDVHRFAGDRKMMLGGVHIECGYGLEAHSDGDVLLHALTDALIGAAGMGDIGRMFPDSDMQYKDISSAELLARALKAINPKRIINADCTVIAQQPHLCGYTDAMCHTIAKLLGCDASRVNVKATTEEGLGFTGRREGIAAHAVVLMEAYGED